MIPRAMPWARSFWAFSPYLNHLRNLSDMYYNKKIAVNPEHLDKVMELVNIKTKIAALEESKHDWFDIAKENGVDINRGYKFTKIEEKTSNLNKRLLNIINSFK
ncbi:MAG: hypothetical protein [Bacteriophage sp.]|nr:MAG: hypothetical protein [Bacteriophage sp.]